MSENLKEHQFDHLYRLICRRDWIADALETILSNKGAKTAGIDGVTKKALKSDAAKAKFVKEIKAELRSKQLVEQIRQPTPQTERTSSNKPHGKLRVNSVC